MCSDNNILANLPAELRVMIYKHALPSGKKLRRTSARPDEFAVSLLLFDRLTYQEAYPIFLQSNTIVITTADWMRAITNKSFSDSVTRLELSDWPHTTTEEGIEALTLLMSLPCLKSVKIEYGPHDGAVVNDSIRRFHAFKQSLLAAPPQAQLNPSIALTPHAIGYDHCLVQNSPGKPLALTFTNTHSLHLLPHCLDAFGAWNDITKREQIRQEIGLTTVDRLHGIVQKIIVPTRVLHGTEVELPKPIADVWLEDGLEDGRIDFMRTNPRFEAALAWALQDRFYYEDSTEKMPWVVVGR